MPSWSFSWFRSWCKINKFSFSHSLVIYLIVQKRQYPEAHLLIPAVIFKISPASSTNVLFIISLVTLPDNDSLKILKVAPADVSVTCTFKLTPPLDPLLICICLINIVASVGHVTTLVCSC